jgi:hypothetical protein
MSSYGAVAAHVSNLIQGKLRFDAIDHCHLTASAFNWGEGLLRFDA